MNSSPPAWNIESEYPSLDSPAFHADFELVSRSLQTMEALLKTISFGEPGPDDIATMQKILRIEEESTITQYNMGVYVNCLLSVNAGDEAARARQSQLQEFASKQGQRLAPLRLYLQRCPENILRAVLADPALNAYEFKIFRAREEAHFLLSEPEEVLLQAMALSGFHSWGTLYEELSGKGKCTLKFADGKTETLSLAQAAALISGPDEEKRRAAWLAVQAFWTEHKSSAAAIANNLAGWRIEVCRKRSHTKPQHFLDPALFNNRITRETLDAMIGCCLKNNQAARRAGQLMAKVMKKEKLEPWDLLSPSPVKSGAGLRSFGEGIEMIREAFQGVDPELGAFVGTMVENRWIEARVLPTKAGGAFCTHFAKSKTPRVFQTYIGSMGNIGTLAHELGHAYHAWVMRDLPLAHTSYPMTLAETASVFAETALSDALYSQARTKEEKIEFAWTNLSSVSSFLINIPARYDYEQAFYERRQKNVLSADELSTLTDQTWTKWYGPTLTRNDQLFWASKMHFSMARSSFYNFPYTFGYLFALSIYARRKDLGAKFMPTYKNILRDTGRMTAEDLVQKHLGEDIRRPEFWQKAIDIELAKIDRFAALLV